MWFMMADDFEDASQRLRDSYDLQKSMGYLEICKGFIPMKSLRVFLIIDHLKAASERPGDAKLFQSSVVCIENLLVSFHIYCFILA